MNNQNYYQKEYEAFRETKLFEELEIKFTPLPYWKKYKTIKAAVLISSYLFNILSGVTASLLFYYFLEKLVGLEVAFGCTFVSVVLLEVLKRKISYLSCNSYLTTNKLPYFSMLFLLLFSTISTLSSFYGSKTLVYEFSPAASFIDLESATSSLNKQINDLDSQIREARETRWAGTTTSASQSAITSLNNQKEILLSEVVRIRKKSDYENDTIKTDYTQSVTISANHFALITLLLEVLFLACAFYLQYYNYRSYVEFYKPVETVATEKETVIPNSNLELSLPKRDSTESIPTDVLQGAIKNAKSNLAAYKAKIKNGQGTLTANKKGVARWKNKLSELEILLPKNGVESH